jgi:IMP dehydrogenase
MQESITFNDVLIKPRFSMIESRKDVDLSQELLGFKIKLPIVSSNMDTVTESGTAVAMAHNGAIGCLHRFYPTVEDNVNDLIKAFKSGHRSVMASVGLGQKELERAEALVAAGCTSLVLDLAHGAQMSVVRQVKQLRELLGYNNFSLIVGNFATSESVQVFLEHLDNRAVQGLKVNIGSGSRCTTRLVTGCGYPALSTVMEISGLTKRTGITIIADGGMDSVGDICKSLAAGAHLVMSGSFFAGCQETPGELVDSRGRKLEFLTDGTVEIEDWAGHPSNVKVFKKYRGSASKESYETQGKIASYRSPEGESAYVPYKGLIKDVLQNIEGGIRSSLTYTGSRNIKEFHERAQFVRVSSNTVIENGTRGGTK